MPHAVVNNLATQHLLQKKFPDEPYVANNLLLDHLGICNLLFGLFLCLLLLFLFLNHLELLIFFERKVIFKHFLYHLNEDGLEGVAALLLLVLIFLFLLAPLEIIKFPEIT